MNLKVVAAFFVSVGLVFPLAPAMAEHRVALVIGNGAYEKAKQLPNPKNDAEDVASALKRIGFETIVGIDLNKTDMEDVAIRFARKARDADVALFYYSGHALQFAGINYLIPVDAELRDEADLRRMARVDQIVQDLQRAKNLRILVLDACRDNPLAEQLRRSIGMTRAASLHRGLARIDTPQGMIVAFSTQAGLTAADGTGRNSPYTTAFLNHIETKEEIGRVFRRITAEVYDVTGRSQLPELSLSFIGEYYLHGKPSLPVAPWADACSVWPQINDTKSVAEVEAFLAECQSGTYRNLAKARLSELERQDVAAITVPPASSSAAKSNDPERTSTPPVHDCDRLAAHPSDPGRMSDGVKFDQIQVEEAVKACQRALEVYPGTARFEYQLGRAFRRKGSYREALTHFRRAADRAHSAAMYILGAMFIEGRGAAKDEAQAVRWFRKAADRGNASGMHNLGVMLQHGLGVARDEAEAVRWFRKAAAKGEANSMYYLGWMYEDGRGVARDEAEAVRWYRKAAYKGAGVAMYHLGVMLAEGRGVEQDEAEAVLWFREAANKGETGAMLWLGIMYEVGRGVREDQDEANRWYRMAKENKTRARTARPSGLERQDLAAIGAPPETAPTPSMQTVVSEADREWANLDKTSEVELQTFISRHGENPLAAYAKANFAAIQRQKQMRIEAQQKAKTISQEAERQTLAGIAPPSKPRPSGSAAKGKAAKDPFTGKWGVNPFCSQYMESITFNGDMATIFRSRRRYSPQMEKINCRIKSRLLGVAIPKMVVSCASGGDHEIYYYRDELLLPAALVGEADWTLNSAGGRFKKCNSQ